jgi:hypothetical protein
LNLSAIQLPAAGSDLSAVPCGKGVWQDQHNAYLSYGPVTARALSAQYHLSAVSGIGLMHSCCNMNIIMPQVYDKISMRNDTINWNFELSAGCRHRLSRAE